MRLNKFLWLLNKFLWLLNKSYQIGTKNNIKN